MLPLIGGWFAKSVLMQSPIGGLLTRVPAKAWLILAILAALFGAYLAHQHAAHKALKQQYDAGYAKGAGDTRAAYAAAQASADKAAARINTTVRKKSDEQARNINRDADDLRVRGPGKATCSGVAGAPRASGGHEPGDRPADVAVDQVPDGGGAGIIALPFADTLAFARQCDLNRNEALRWREADGLQREASEKSRAATPGP